MSNINNTINNIMPLSSFTVFTLNEEETALESKAIFDKENNNRQFSILLNDKESFNVVAYLSGETVAINSQDDVYQLLGVQKMRNLGCTKTNSAMFIPIKHDNKVVAVISLQSNEKNVFSKEYQQFFEGLSPFLVIAINNAKYSENLKNEIESHKITQQKLQTVNKELKKLSTLDSLTQIYNRMQFDNMYSKFLKKAEKEGLSINVCLFDIDKFKNYNDTYGHFEGDKVLVQVANIIKDQFENKNSIVARFDGEEFIAVQVVETEAEILNDLNEICSKIRNLAIENKDSIHGYITISIGVSSNEKPCLDTKSDMMRQTDECLYMAKSKGKNQVIQSTF